MILLPEANRKNETLTLEQQEVKFGLKSKNNELSMASPDLVHPWGVKRVRGVKPWFTTVCLILILFHNNFFHLFFTYKHPIVPHIKQTVCGS